MSGNGGDGDWVYDFIPTAAATASSALEKHEPYLDPNGIPQF